MIIWAKGVLLGPPLQPGPPKIGPNGGPNTQISFAEKAGLSYL